MGTGEAGEPDSVDIFLHCGFGDLGRRLVEPGVDHLASGITEDPRDNFGPTIVAIETGLCDEDSAGHTGSEG